MVWIKYVGLPGITEEEEWEMGEDPGYYRGELRAFVDAESAQHFVDSHALETDELEEPTDEDDDEERFKTVNTWEFVDNP